MGEGKKQRQDWGISYGQMVWREFYKSALNTASLLFVLCLFLMAIFAPFLANDKPYSIVIDGVTQYPLFRNLTPVDYSIFLAGFLALIQWYLLRRNIRKVDPSLRGGVLACQLLGFGVVLVIGMVLIWTWVPRRLDATDYRTLMIQGKATRAKFPLVPFGYDRTDLQAREQKPNRVHWLGTDDVGSDVLARLIHGSRVSLSVGFVAVGIAVLVGVFVGSFMGFFGGWVDFLGMRFVEIMMAIPVFFLIITIVAFFPRNLFNIMAIIGLTTWTTNARFIRAEFLRLRDQDFVQSARVLGLPLRSILFRHMLPNGIAPVLVNATFGISSAILIEASLSFLGFGVAPPTPSWGQMLSLGVGTTGRFLWWLSLFPGLAIFLTVVAYNLVGEGLRDAIDPRLRKAA
ncbi:MAG: ABC transporter permease [Sedimentisphaerales bacterium]|nr:ABC transporter permease [Sedimentisphaerales bacterium]